ncbi:MAG: PQQ-dependent sugar dehydrogenase [Cytophagaceae bacterium]
MRCPIITLFIIFTLIFQSYSANLPSGFIEQILADKIDPVDLTVLPDGRIIIVEKNGRALLYKNGQLQSDPFLEVNADNYNERGFQTIVLDPHFEHNNYIYLYYTKPGGYNVVSRFTVSGDYALPGSENIILEMDPMPGSIHNGGAMVFDNDGKLIIATGDGGQGSNAQSTNNLLGKILRINTDGSIPQDNPFYNTYTGKNRAIYALGFRNPFSMDIVKETGDILINDVGHISFEEVNRLVKGGNYGWPTIEGVRTTQTAPANYQDPIHAYGREGWTRCAIVGGCVYQPELKSFPPQYWGNYFFADYCNGTMYYLNPVNGAVIGSFVSGLDRLVAIKSLSDGSMLYLQRSGIRDGSIGDNTSTANGALWKISYTGQGTPFISKHPSNVLAATGETVSFSVVASGNTPLTYSWKVNGEVVQSGPSNVLTLQNIPASLNGASIVCTVSNTLGSASTSPAILTVVNSERPVPVIHSPSSGTLYKGGDILTISGSAQSAGGTVITDDKLFWKIDFHHDDHTHPALSNHIGSSGSYNIPRVGETSDNVWYRIYLTATDENGLSGTTFRDVYPVKSNIRVSSLNGNQELRLEGKRFYGDTTFTSVVGLLRSVKAPEIQILGDSVNTFHSWGNGSTNSVLDFFVPQNDTVITARFTSTPLAKGNGLNRYFYSTLTRFNNNNHNVSSIGNVDFNWGNGSPSGIPADNFWGRFEGFVEPIHSAEYTFYTLSDDGVNLWVNNQQLINDWTDHAAREFSGKIYLEAGRRYPIKLEYYEKTGGALVHLFWSAINLPKEIIPARQLFVKNSHGLNFEVIPAKTYGDAPFTIKVSSLSGLPIQINLPSNHVASINGNSITIIGAGTVDIEATQAATAAYDQSHAVRKLVVRKAELTVAAENKFRPYGVSNPEFTYSYAGFVYNENESVITGIPHIVSPANELSPSGTYPINISKGSLSSDNYNFNFVDGVLTVDYPTSTESIGNSYIKISPNPSAGRFHIECTDSIKEVMLINSLGQTEIYYNTSAIEPTMKGLLKVIVKTDKGEFTTKVIAW